MSIHASSPGGPRRAPVLPRRGDRQHTLVEALGGLGGWRASALAARCQGLPWSITARCQHPGLQWGRGDLLAVVSPLMVRGDVLRWHR